MKLMRGALWLLLSLAIGGFGGSFALESSYVARAEKIQCVRIVGLGKFGPITKDIGEPDSFIVDDPSVFLKNRTATGYRMLDLDALKRRGEALVRPRDMEAVIWPARLGCILSIIVAALGLVLLDRVRNWLIPPDP